MTAPFTIRSAPLVAVQPKGDFQYEQIKHAWKELADLANGIIPSKLPVEPEAEDFREVIKDLQLLARKVDWLIATYGDYVAANTPRKVEIELFQDQLSSALDGNACYEIEACAERVIEDREELAEGDSDAKWAERV